MRSVVGTKAVVAAGLVAVGLFTLPLLAHAQAPASDLSATIRAELLKDPRTASLSSAELDAMVSILASEAQRQGVTASDITWNPAADIVAEVVDACGDIPKFSCIFGLAFGFIGPDPTIPYILGVTSMGLVWLLAEMIHRRRYPVQAQAVPPTQPMWQ